tara:strand:- start:30 stop:332 length:303 start_codon:yes stop_codon:yes gene_type:complete
VSLNYSPISPPSNILGDWGLSNQFIHGWKIPKSATFSGKNLTQSTGLEKSKYYIISIIQSTLNIHWLGFLKNLCLYLAIIIYPISLIGRGINHTIGNHIE